MSKLDDTLTELYEAGYTLGDNQWSGDMGTLMDKGQAKARIKDFFMELAEELKEEHIAADDSDMYFDYIEFNNLIESINKL